MATATAPYNSLNVRCNLEVELNRVAQQALVANGYKFNFGHKLTAFQQYLNVSRRCIPVISRRVYAAPCLQCPFNHQQGLQQLLAAATSGENLNAYLSTNIRRASFTDQFLTDFGFHHFHLGPSLKTMGEEKGFVERTGYILIALVLEHAFYAVAIKKHGKGGDALLWCRQEFLEINPRYWPQSIRQYRLNGIKSSSSEISSEKRKMLRGKGGNAFISMPDGTVYMSPGGGITTAKTSVEITRQADYWFEQYQALLQAIVEAIFRHRYKIQHFPVQLHLVSIEQAAIFKNDDSTIYFLAKHQGVNVVVDIKILFMCDLFENRKFFLSGIV